MTRFIFAVPLLAAVNDSPHYVARFMQTATAVLPQQPQCPPTRAHVTTFATRQMPLTLHRRQLSFALSQSALLPCRSRCRCGRR